MPEDVAVWERFIEKFPGYYDTCQYDVPVGSVPSFVTGDPDPSARAQEKLYRKKIDVLAYSRESDDLIELKPVCTMSTIGQVKGYKHFYMRDYKPEREPRPVVMCGAASEDVREFAHQEGVTIIVV